MTEIKKDVSNIETATSIDLLPAADKRRVIDHLPNVNQTDTLKKFFNATIDHLFQPKATEKFSAYVGRRPSYWDQSKEFYLQEINKTREDYQLEPAMVSLDQDNSITHTLFYDDLLNGISFQGGIVTDHNRLFEQDYYSWAPPIDLDKLTAYTNYFWLEAGPDPVVITEATDVTNDIIGELQYTLPTSGLVLSSGMRITLQDDASTTYNNKTWGVEAVGRGIMLLDLSTEEEVIGWEDGPWDESPWSTGGTPSTGIDYIVIERGCVDGNPWSKGNKWYHKDVITASGNTLISTVFEHRAERPIIEFERDLELYDYGRTVDFTADVVYTETNDIFGALDGVVVWEPSLALTDPVNINWKHGTQGYAAETVGGISVAMLIDGVSIRDDLIIMVTNDDNSNVNNKMYKVSGIETTGRISLQVQDTPVVITGTQAQIKYGISYENSVIKYNGTGWGYSQRKISENQAPLFNAFDIDNTLLDDAGVYPKSTFAGTKIFGYKIATSTSQTDDSVLGFKVSKDQYGETIFENFIVTERHDYSDPATEIDGLYFWRIRPTGLTVDDRYSNNWNQIEERTKQFVIDEYVVSEALTFTLSQAPETRGVGGLPTIVVFKNGNTLEETVEYSVSGVTLTVGSAVDGDFIVAKTFNSSSRPEEGTVKYEIPLNLQGNPTYQEVENISNSDYFTHFKEIMENQLGFTGSAYGVNNWRDTAQNKTFGRQVIQHRAPLLKTMLLSSDENLDYMLAVRYAEKEYTRFRNRFIQKLNVIGTDLNYQGSTTTAKVNAAIDAVNIGKTISSPFYYSGMMSDKNHIPPTPSRLGVAPVYKPEAYLDDTFVNPQWVIRGHDGSQYVMIGEISGSEQTFDPVDLTEEVDKAILEFENRIYTAIPTSYKTDAVLDFDILSLIPGRYRTVDYTRTEYLSILRSIFERWVSFKGVNYRDNTTYSEVNKFTWNYSSSLDRDGNRVPGNWRAIYHYFYDTDRPHTHPWEMLGFTEKPSWWVGRYGGAPYTGGNALLWTDLEAGYIADGDRQGTDTNYVRTGLSNIIPVDNTGMLLDPIAVNIIATPPTQANASAPWVFGDGGPVEGTWIKSEVYPFALAQVGYLMKPARFIELGWDADRYSYVFENTATYQWVNTETKNRPKYNTLLVHGEKDSAGDVYIGSGIQQWISSRVIDQGQNITTKFGDVLRGLDVRLGHKLGGFTDSDNLKATADNFGQLPQEDITVKSHLSPSIREHTYSGVVVKWTGAGWEVFGYDTVSPSFNIIAGNETGRKATVSVGETAIQPEQQWVTKTSYTVNTKVQYQGIVYKASEAHTSTQNFDRSKWSLIGNLSSSEGIRVQEYLDPNIDGDVTEIPYGTIFQDQQSVYNFLIGYERWLGNEGWLFDQINYDTNDTYNWRQAGKEFLWWTLSKWDAGNFLALSPLATKVKFSAPHGAVQSVEQLINGVYTILDKTGSKINPKDTNVARFDDILEITPDDPRNGIFKVSLAVKEFEHIVLFSNTTIFNDTVYDVLFNIRQERLKLNGFRSKNWTGRLDAPGFIVGGDSLYSNFDKTSDDFRNLYEIETSIEEPILREHARHIIGYQVRDYLQALVPDPDNSFQFYQGMIQSKGTPNSLDKILKVDTLTGSSETFTFYEEWMFRVGRFGADAIRPSLEIQIDRSEIRNNPQLIEFPTVTDNTFNLNIFDNPYDDDIRIWTHKPTDLSTPTIDSRWMRRPVDNESIWPLRSSLGDTLGDTLGDLPSAGYVKLDEIDWTAVSKDDIVDLYQTAENATTPLELGNTIWVYDDGLGQFMVYRVSELENARIQVVDAGAPTFIELDRTVSLEAGDFVIIPAITSTSPNLEGIQTVSMSTSNSFSIDMTTDTGYNYLAENETGPEVFVLENVRFANNDVRDASFITWQLNDHVWVDDARTATEVSNDMDVYWATYKYDPSHVDANLDGWVEVRRDTLRVDSNRIINGVVYNKRTHKYESTFEVYDPRKGFIPGIADKEIAYKLEYDPAKYTDGDESLHQLDAEQAWGPSQVGLLWWDISAVKYLDYEIADNKYRTNQWGKLAPGTSIDIYEWVRSSVAPDAYDTLVVRGGSRDAETRETGTVKGVTNPAWVSREEYDAGGMKTYYYFWVKNVENAPSIPERSLAAINVSRIIENPTQNNVVWCAAICEDALITSNVQSALVDEDTVIQINWKLGDTESNLHSQWELVSEANPKSIPPTLLWNKMRDSLVGYDAVENVVPDVNLTEIERYGTLIRPRQTWFKDATMARKIFVESANTIFAAVKIAVERTGYDLHLSDAEAIPTTGFDYTVADIDARDALIGTITTGQYVLVQANTATGNRWTVWEYTNIIGKTWTRTDIQEYKVDEFWDYTVWYDTGITADTNIDHIYADNAALNSDIAGGHVFYTNDIVKILDDGNGVYNLLKYDGTTFDIVAIENGTIVFSDLLYTYDQATNINTLPYPHKELRILVAAIKDDIMLAVESNKMFFAQVNYVHSEQEMVDWAVKTSLLNLSGFESSVSQQPVQVDDITDSILAYIEEVKPYHTKIRDIVQSKSLTREDLIATPTDFDKPIYTDTSVEPSVNRKLYLDLADYLKDHGRDDPSGTNFNSDDITILQSNTPWKQWYDDYIDNASVNVRQSNIKIKFDRVKCYTDIPFEGANTDGLVLLASATTPNNTSEYNIFTVTNSNITINKIIMEITDTEVATYVGDSLTTTFKTPFVITDSKSLSVTKNSVVIYENGVSVSVLAENQFIISTTGDGIIFDLAPNTGDTIEVIVDESFSDPNAYITIGNTVNDVLLPETILQGPDNESDISLSGSLNFSGTKEILSDYTFGYDSNVKVVIAPGTSIGGKVTVIIEYTLDVRLGDFIIGDLDAADRVALFYNPRAGMERKALTIITETPRVKGESIYLTNTTDDIFYRKRYSVGPISGCDFKGTVVDGVADGNTNLDTLLDGTSSDWTTVLFTAGIDGTDVFTLDTPLENVNDAKVSVNGVPVTLSIEYDIPDPPRTQIVFNPSDVPAVGEVIQVVIGTTFEGAPTGSSDIIIDGNEFLQPHWASDRPEELSVVDMDTSLNFSIYFPGTEGSPIVVADRFISDGVTTNYPLLQLPQSNEGVLVYAGGLFLDHGVDYTIDWTTREIAFINVPASTVSVKVVVFSHGGNRVVDNLLRDGGTDTYTLTQPSIQNNVLVFVDGDPETGFTVSGRTVTLSSTPPAASKVLLVAFGTTVLEQIIETGDGTTDTYTLTETPAAADRILAMVDNAPATFTLSGNDVIFDTVPVDGSTIAITLFEVKSPTLIKTESFTGIGGIAGSESGSRVYTLSANIEATLPKASSIIVKKNGLRIAPENTTYIETNAYQRVYLLEATVASPETDITLWSDDVVMTWGVDYAVPTTLRGVFDSSLDMVTNLTNLGMTVGSLQAGDYFNIINTVEVSSVIINEGGTGYTVNDVLTIVGGTGTAATITVDSVSAGVITAISLTTDGSYTVQPNNPVSVTGGTGSNATINLFFTARIMDFDADWDVTIPGIPTVASFDNGTAIVYNGSSFSVIQNVTTPTLELHFEEVFAAGELVKLTTNGDKDYIVSGDDEVTIYDVVPADDIDITYFSVDTTFNIHTQVFEESMDGSYRISQIPFNGDYIWVTVNGYRKVYMRDYRILKKDDGWDTSPWDTTSWDSASEYNVIQMNPYDGTQAEFDLKTKDKIIITTMTGPPVSESISYRMFKDFNKDGFGNWEYSRIADVHKFRLRADFNIGDSSIDLDVNENVLVADLPDSVLFNPTDSTPGVVFVDNERIEYWELAGPFVDGTTDRDWYRVSTLARGTKLTPTANYSAGTMVIETGENQAISLPYDGAIPDTDAVPTADMAISATAQSTTAITNGTDVEFSLGVTPSFATITSIYTDISDTSTLIDQSAYTLSNDVVTFNTAPEAGSIAIVQVVPDSINLQKITNSSTVFLNDRPGHYET